MRTLVEINTRISEIIEELEKPDTDYKALGEELRNLKDEKTELEEKEKKKAEARSMIAAGGGTVIASRKEEDMENEHRTVEEIVKSPEYRSAWLKRLQRKTLNETEQRAYASGDTANAVPTVTSDRFIEKMKKLAPMLSEITLLNVMGNVKFTAEGTRNEATAKHTENSAVDAAADTVVNVTLGGYEFIKLIQISKAAELMSLDAFETWLVDMLAGDIARSIEKYIISDATNGISAITYTTNTNQILNTASTGYAYSDFCSLISLIPAAYDGDAKFLVNKKTLWTRIKSITETGGKPIFDPESKTLMGYPVVVSDYVGTTKNEVYLGYWRDIVGNLQNGIEVARSEEAGFESASIKYRGYALFDSKPAKTDAIARLVSTTT